MPHVGFITAVRHVDERDGLVECEYLFVGWIVRRRQLRFDDVTELGHVLGHVVVIDYSQQQQQQQQYLLLQADHSQGELRLNLNSFFGVLEFVGLRHRLE